MSHYIAKDEMMLIASEDETPSQVVAPVLGPPVPSQAASAEVAVPEPPMLSQAASAEVAVCCALLLAFFYAQDEAHA